MEELLALLIVTDALGDIDMSVDNPLHDVDIDALTKRTKDREASILARLKALSNKEEK
jgi:hypothetical protein